MTLPKKDDFYKWASGVYTKQDADVMTSQLKATPFDITDRDVSKMSNQNIDDWVENKIKEYLYGEKGMYRMVLPNGIPAYMGESFITYLFTQEIKKERDELNNYP
tara:strand:+ start:835 stop:1149 length:315 start_codon:yes stop_codon:yes gene_type:complete